ncbi:MAG TPA: FkbM family methyltransferase [Actinophytocola sp.]|uniref:FkbM family methyltransferase n=1 Tax=Actinophytocola sp. TaxID=1872138 RepID=UPI002DBCA903|nr:FkbM family methyltransferase [Actinophytocola sp.]HEU5475407.1 FkbM family methyltransferase [Actinophytocola sp.]
MARLLPVRPVTKAVSAVSALVPDRLLTAGIALTYRRFEPELRRLDDFCPRRGTALDVGAWYGPWSRALARQVDTVIAFEPNPEVAAVLASTVPGNVRVVRSAASDHIGEETLWVPGEGLGTEGVASLRAPANPGARAVSVPTTTIDALDLADVTMIKLDVEGAELAALRGAADTLRRCRPVLLIELEYRHGPVDEVLAFLGEFGYSGEILLGRTWRPLAGFDLAGHQRAVAPRFRGYLHTVLLGGPRYVNNILFRAP